MKSTIDLTMYDDDGEEVVHTFPAKYDVCPECDGYGTHSNPSIDGNGITGSEMEEILHEDPDFLDNYMGGMYDVTCYQCHGQRVVWVPNEDACTPEQLKVLKEWQEKEAEIAREIEADNRTMRMECGGW